MVLKIFMKIFILIIIILIAVISVVYFYLKKYMDEPTKLLTTYYDNKKQIENIKGEQYYTPEGEIIVVNDDNKIVSHKDIIEDSSKEDDDKSNEKEGEEEEEEELGWFKENLGDILKYGLGGLAILTDAADLVKLGKLAKKGSKAAYVAKKAAQSTKISTTSTESGRNIGKVAMKSQKFKKVVKAISKSSKEIAISSMKALKKVGAKTGKVAAKVSSKIVSKVGPKIAKVMAIGFGIMASKMGKMGIKAASKAAKSAKATAKVAGKVAKGVGKGLKVAGAGLKAAKNATRGIPVAGVGMALAAGAFCFAAANEEKLGAPDNDREKTEANIACGIELLLDLALEGALWAAKGAVLAAAGPAAAILLLFMITVAVLDLIDPCAFDRPLFDNKMIDGIGENLKSQTWLTIGKELSKTLAEEFLNAFRELLQEQIDDDGNRRFTDSEIEEMLKSEFELYGEKFNVPEMISKALEEGIKNAKYPKPMEFVSDDNGLTKLNSTDTEIFKGYMQEYYNLNQLMIPRMSFEEMKEIVIKTRSHRKQRRERFDIFTGHVVSISDMVSEQALKSVKVTFYIISLSILNIKAIKDALKLKIMRENARKKLNKEINRKIAEEKISEAEVARLNANFELYVMKLSKEWENKQRLARMTMEENGDLREQLLKAYHMQEVEFNEILDEIEETDNIISYIEDEIVDVSRLQKVSDAPKSYELLTYVISVIVIIIVLFIAFEFLTSSSDDYYYEDVYQPSMDVNIPDVNIPDVNIPDVNMSNITDFNLPKI